MLGVAGVFGGSLFSAMHKNELCTVFKKKQEKDSDLLKFKKVYL